MHISHCLTGRSGRSLIQALLEECEAGRVTGHAAVEGQRLFAALESDLSQLLANLSADISRYLDSVPALDRLIAAISIGGSSIPFVAISPC